jgi:hypothetical protein
MVRSKNGSRLHMRWIDKAGLMQDSLRQDFV